MYNTISSNEKGIKGGCRGLIEYLDKEETLSERFIKYLDKESQFAFDEKLYFFNGIDKEIDNETVINAIDNNRKGLSRDDAYFYSLTIDPSREEIKHIYDTYVLPVSETLLQSGAPGDIEQIKDGLMRRYLTDYAVKSMDLYAQNFGRKGVESNKDLVWFGRVEKDRYWKENSREVRHNKKIYDRISKLMLKPSTPKTEKNIERLRSDLILESDVREGGKSEPIQAMMRKSGDNYHIHVIVSRKDKTQKIKLSPLAKARENEEHKVGGRECKIGFDRNRFTNGVEELFDAEYLYQRPIEERYEFRKEQALSKDLPGRERTLEMEDRLGGQEIIRHQKFLDYISGEESLSGSYGKGFMERMTAFVEMEEARAKEWERNTDPHDKIPYFVYYDGFDPFDESMIPVIGYMSREEYELYQEDPEAERDARIRKFTRDYDNFRDKSDEREKEWGKERIRKSIERNKLSDKMRGMEPDELERFKLSDEYNALADKLGLPVGNIEIGSETIFQNVGLLSHTGLDGDRMEEQGFFSEKLRAFDSSSLIPFSDSDVFDPWGGVDRARQVGFIKESLCNILPYCNTMDEFYSALRIRGINPEIYRNEDGYRDLRFSIEMVNDVINLQDIPNSPYFYGIKKYIENEWREYFYQKKVRGFDSPLVDRPEIVRLDMATGVDRAGQVRFIEQSLHEILPYSNDMEYFRDVLGERGIILNDCRDGNGFKDISFNIDGVKDKPIRFQELCGDLGYFDIRNYIEKEWRQYFYKKKVRGFDSPPVDRPAAVVFDPSQGIDHARQVRFVEGSLRESLPYCNTMGELERMLKERGIDMITRSDTLLFSLDAGTDAIELKEISKNLNLYDLEKYVKREWNEYFYRPKKRLFDSEPVKSPMAVLFDPDQGVDQDRRVRFVEGSLREVFPYCNSMGELTGMLQERGITAEVYRDEKAGTNMRFSIDGVDAPAISLQDISDNLKYYELKYRVEREWQEYFYQPKVRQFGSDPIERPMAVLFDPDQGVDQDRRVRFVEGSLRDSLPYCNTMAELEGMLKERGIIPEVYRDEDTKINIRFNIDGLDDVTPIKLEDISDNLQYHKLRNRVESEWKRDYFKEKVQGFDSPAVDRPVAVVFDPSQGLGLDKQVRFVENSLCDSLPYCNTMAELEGMLKERGITAEIFKNEDGYRDLRFTVDGIGSDPVRLQDLSGDLRYFEMKKYIEREWREYYYQEKVRGFDSPLVDRPAAVAFDPSQGIDHARQVRFVEGSLRESLPYCNTMGELEGMLKERGIMVETFKDGDGYRDLRFTVDGVGPDPVRLQDLSGDLRYFDIKHYIEREWREYYYQEKVQGFDSPLVDRPAAVAFDPSQGIDHARQVRFVESSLRDSLPYCNTMAELEGMLKERGVDLSVGYGEDKRNTLYFNLGGETNIELKELSGDLRYYEVKGYVEREWRQYFYQEKVQGFDSPPVDRPAAVVFDPSQGIDHARQVRFVESSLRDSLPYCNAMAELEGMLKERGITAEVFKNNEGRHDLRFTVDGVGSDPVHLRDISDNLRYYEVKSYVQKEWNEYFFLPKQQEQDILYTSFNHGVDATSDIQRTYILDALRNTMPYCDTFSGLKDKLGKQGIDMESFFVKNTGREMSFHIQGVDNPVRFLLRELHPNLDYWGMVNHVGKDDLIYNGSQSVAYEAVLSMTAKKLMYETGLKYIHDSVKPYQQTVSLGISGLRILTSDGLAKDKAALLAKNIASAFGHKMGFAVLGGVAQYVNPYVMAISLLKQGISAGLSGHDR